MKKSQQASQAVREFLASIGRKGGVARQATLTRDQRRQLARKAALTRWRRWRKRRSE